MTPNRPPPCCVRPCSRPSNCLCARRAFPWQIPQGDSDAASDTWQDLVERLLRGRRAIGRDLDGLLRAHARTAGLTLPGPRTVSNPFDAALVRTAARLLMGGTADVSPEELTDVWRSVWAGPPGHLDRITAAHLAADHAGGDLRAFSSLTHGLPGWVRAGGIAPDGQLGEAAITLSTVQYLLVPGSTRAPGGTGWTPRWSGPSGC
ncbi:hypothetical protein AB0F45_34920, partial [Streptomyces achromogenes]